MTTPLMIRSTNDLIYDYALSSAYKSSWVYDQDFALSRDADIWEVMRRDANLMSSIDRRNRSIIRPWHIEPAKNSKEDSDKILSDICEDAFTNIEQFDAARYQMAEATLLGRSYHYVEGDIMYLSLAGLPPMDWWIPRNLKHVDRRRFRWVPVHGPATPQNPSGPLRTRLDMFNTEINQWVPLDADSASYFVRYTWYDTEDRLGYGRGLLEALFFAHYMKAATFVKVAQGIDRWANGTIIGSIDSLRNASTGKTNEDLRRGMITLLQNMRSEHVVVKQNGDEIELVETSGAGHEISMNFVHYLDEACERLLHGSILPSGHANDTGSNARAQQEGETTEGFHQYERKLQDEVTDRQLLSLFLRLNAPNIARLGLAGTKRPRFHSEQEAVEDPEKNMNIAGQAMDRGVELVKSEFYKKIGYSVPGPGDETVKRSTPMMEGGFGGEGGPGDGFGKPNERKPGEKSNTSEPKKEERKESA